MTATLHRAPVVLPVAGEPVRDGAVLVENDRVVAVGPAASVDADGARVREWPGVLLPGLVNAHTHLQYTDFADLATSGLPFPVWIRTLTERRRTWTAEQWRESARHGVHEALRTGTTCVADVVSNVEMLPVLARSGLAGTAFVEVVGVESYRWPEERDVLLAKLAAAPSGIDVGVSPHALYSLGTDAVRGSLAVARERGLRLHPHLAETDHEVEYVARGTGPIADFGRGLTFELIDNGTGRTPVAEADGLGLLGPDVHVAHGVHVTAEDRALLRSRGTAVALCVRSNRILGAGEPPVAAYLAEGSPVAVGTDSRASSPSLDLVEEVAALRDLALAQGASPDGLARRLVEAATAGGAAALGRDDVGRLAPGGRADLAAFDVPVDGDPYEALLAHGAGRCVATVLGGRIVHRR
ncbi:MAG TPA: amidohydrolase family protein [Mycobacteriales bacterium]|jgi:cytosine/adenosine deaminase-related metal-dependent hydrolase|nr:amidohydrolase family protein [Mycobacteriales bacterium]